MPAFTARSRRVEMDLLTIDRDASLIRRRDAEEDARQFRAPRADEPREAEDFARMRIEAHLAHTGRGAAEIAHLQDHLFRAAFRRRINRAHFAPDHELDEPRLIHFRYRMRPRAFTIAQDSHTITDLEDFFEPM